ncbi:hypothetical protein [Sutcliffiella rhizosphaerae]|uniref:Twin transmembrane helix small protein n=1 Tax=Sutcliffiella rhizosphaerae TaxID=2880967 RepID=A0ABN8AH27_9BACI|nr:hypothetical protein [Sutcliffiella rhizosphaerae]CAG9623022.1 hypothetical protein BACCIP111883_03817 [Sutcliffiella rhizosphaerae]
MMFWLGIISILILIAGLVATIQVAGKGDRHYQKATKGNVIRLSSIYIVLLVIIVVGFIIYLN